MKKLMSILVLLIISVFLFGQENVSIINGRIKIGDILIKEPSQVSKNNFYYFTNDNRLGGPFGIKGEFIHVLNYGPLTISTYFRDINVDNDLVSVLNNPHLYDYSYSIGLNEFKRISKYGYDGTDDDIYIDKGNNNVLYNAALMYNISLSNVRPTSYPNKFSENNIFYYPYWFMYDSIPYILSYEDNLDFDNWNYYRNEFKSNRGLYLFKYDFIENDWVKVFNTPIRTDYYNDDHDFKSIRKTNGEFMIINRPSGYPPIICLFISVVEYNFNNQHTEMLFLIPNDNSFIVSEPIRIPYKNIWIPNADGLSNNSHHLKSPNYFTIDIISKYDEIIEKTLEFEINNYNQVELMYE